MGTEKRGADHVTPSGKYYCLDAELLLYSYSCRISRLWQAGFFVEIGIDCQEATIIFRSKSRQKSYIFINEKWVW